MEWKYTVVSSHAKDEVVHCDMLKTHTARSKAITKNKQKKMYSQ